MTTITRDVTLNFFRSCPVSDCVVKRGETQRKYKLTESSIARWQKFLRKNRDIKPEVDFLYFTEITFYLDKIVYEEEE